MITDSFDDKSEAIINPLPSEKLIECDVCIITFSKEIENYVLKTFNAEQIGTFRCVNSFPVYLFSYKNKKIAIYTTLLGAPASVGIIEDVSKILNTKKFLVFGSTGALDKDKCHNKIVVPTYAYRDEGTSYHYAKPADYIRIENSLIVSSFMKENKIPYVEGKVWTTDAFYRETKNNFNKRSADGCISVDMECAAMQAVCNYRNLDLYYFMISGDVLDAPEWDNKKLNDANHNISNFNIALALACEI